MIKKGTFLVFTLLFSSIALGGTPGHSPTQMQCGSPEHIKQVAYIMGSYKTADVLKKKRLVGKTLHMIADLLLQGGQRGEADRALTKLGHIAEQELGCTGGRAWIEYIVNNFFSPESSDMLKEMLRSVCYDYCLSLTKYALHGIDESKLETWFNDMFERSMRGDWQSFVREYEKPFRAFFTKFAQESFGLSKNEAESWVNELMKKHSTASPEKKKKFEDVKREAKKMPGRLGNLLLDVITIKKEKAQKHADHQHEKLADKGFDRKATKATKHRLKHFAKKSQKARR